MSRSGPLFAAVVLAVAMCVVPTQAAYFFDIWGASADGSMDLVNGYSIADGSGSGRFTRSYHSMSYMGFNGLSDGPDKIPPGKTGDLGDGVALASWLVGKKAFNAVLYFRDADRQTCDPAAPAGTYLNDPVVVLGFRCANAGQFIDHDAAGSGAGGTYVAPWIGGGDMAPPAWRMGPPPYQFKGDIGAGEFYKFSARDTQNASQPARWWNAQYAAWSGFNDQANRFAFGWIVEHSDAHLANSATIGSADCSGADTLGGDEPRDLNHDFAFGEGWYAKKIDRGIINGLGSDPEMKGLVFQSVASTYLLNTPIFSREQGDGVFAPYLAIYATWAGDVDNDGCVNVVDLLTLAPAFGLHFPEIGFDPEADLNCDGSVNLLDLLIVSEQFGGPCL